ncbi:hypothetical protein M378DRAFT_165762 [Amanita muscaria Koide BX008]|uniref:Uncharacterized protein n=1 Tax=Amanita muscaria (strain Koide BX008) TaxID=946122 RepID=A0A0C2X130_AMAMK|nr:hypothetical protein M378DRAFT_165762 [Amanita muscaria Koide BX008]
MFFYSRSSYLPVPHKTKKQVQKMRYKTSSQTFVFLRRASYDPWFLWTPAAASRFFDSAKAELPRLRVSLRHLRFPNSPHAKYIFIDNHKQWKHTSCKNFS